MVAILKAAQFESVNSKHGAASKDADPISPSASWPWDQYYENQQPIKDSCSRTPAVSCVGVFRPVTPVAQHKPQLPYSLSSHAVDPHSHSGRRSAISASSSSSSSSSSAAAAATTHCHAASLPSIPSSESPTTTRSLWVEDNKDEDAAPQLPPVHPGDHMKTLLTQLASCISSITSVYAHQQAALFSHSAPAAIGEDKVAALSATDIAMVEELQSLSRLHSQLALLPHTLTIKDGNNAIKEDLAMRLQLKRYEVIIARFHDEIWQKNAVAEALKETLAKSMLKGEKLQKRVNAMEAQLAAPLHVRPLALQLISCFINCCLVGDDQVPTCTGN